MLIRVSWSIGSRCLGPSGPKRALRGLVISRRAPPSDPSVAPHRPEWALPLEQAILHGTRESAYAAWLEHLTGMIQVGLAADLVVLDRDVIEEGSKALLDAGVRLTMMGGEVTYSPTGTGSL